MSTKISALPAASAPNITDATVVPLVDATTTTVKVSVAQLRTQLTSVALTVAAAGGITVNGGASRTTGVLVNANAAVNRDVVWQTAGVDRWYWRVDNTAEAGANAGSGIGLLAFSDAGALIGTAVSFDRASLAVTFTGNATHNGVITIPSTVASVAGTGTNITLGATTQTTIGANGAASALTANPLGYLVFYKGATKCVLPFYNG